MAPHPRMVRLPLIFYGHDFISSGEPLDQKARFVRAFLWRFTAYPCLKLFNQGPIMAD